MSIEQLIQATRQNLLKIVGIFVVIVLLSILGGCSKSENNGGGESFPEPEERRSEDGILNTILEVSVAKNFIENTETGELDEVNTPTYEGRLIGPTLRIEPGNSIQISMINNLPENPDNQRMGAFPHDPFTTNFHSHGLTVDP